jgi:hypothetical protein
VIYHFHTEKKNKEKYRKTKLIRSRDNINGRYAFHAQINRKCTPRDEQPAQRISTGAHTVI